MADKRIQVAKDYICSHKNDTAEDWFLQCSYGNTDDDKYLEIYAKLESGVFGECRDNAEYDEDGEVVREATEFEVEIIGRESKSGSPVIFKWSVD